MSIGKSPTQYLGVLAKNPPNLTQAERAPTSSDTAFPIGELWLDRDDSTAYMNNGAGDWIAIGSGADGGVVTLTGGSGGAISPTAGNITLAGTANQIKTIGSGSTITWSVPSTFIAPGSIAATTTLTATLGDITATNGNIVRGTAGNKDVYSSVASTTTAGANSAGTVTLVSGTATVATTAITASSQVRLYRQSVGSTGAAALGILTLGTKTAGVSFVINAVTAASAVANQTTDVSVIGWEIVN